MFYSQIFTAETRHILYLSHQPEKLQTQLKVSVDNKAAAGESQGWIDTQSTGRETDWYF